VCSWVTTSEDGGVNVCGREIVTRGFIIQPEVQTTTRRTGSIALISAGALAIAIVVQGAF